MLVKLDHFPKDWDEHLNEMKPPPGNIAPENSWLQDKPFLFGARPIFRGCVSFRECTPPKTNEGQWKILTVKEDISPIKKLVSFFHCHLTFQGCILTLPGWWFQPL